jgi:hypothetical protein
VTIAELAGTGVEFAIKQARLRKFPDYKKCDLQKR